ncbi:hypothetical protein [Microbacterium sp.]|uniref:hypothetical protein n=1 Tax=Microbacterium sp. TaxID=51671 RepID=UPI003A8997F0
MTTELAVNLGNATLRRLLVDWTNSHDAWVRQPTAETILPRQTPGEDFLDAVELCDRRRAALSRPAETAGVRTTTSTSTAYSTRACPQAAPRVLFAA